MPKGFNLFVFFTFCLSFLSCVEKQANRITSVPIIVSQQKSMRTFSKDTFELERYLISNDLININSLDTSIQVSLLYSTSHNFLNKPVYQGLTNCYLPCEVAIKLCNAQWFLKQQFPDYSIIVFDGVRPLYIQKQMWDELKMPPEKKINYLAHPNDISLHNYGAAVDVGIIGSNNVLLNMGTSFDHFGELSEPRKEQQLYKSGKLSKNALANRLLLREIMLRAGFATITTEWWHFNATTKVLAASKYKLIE